MQRSYSCQEFVDYVKKLAVDDTELARFLKYHHVDHTFDVHHTTGLTLLTMAIRYSLTKLFTKLLELGASTDCPLHLTNAIYYKNYIGVSALICHGARPGNSSILVIGEIFENERVHTKFIVNVLGILQDDFNLPICLWNITEKFESNKISIEQLTTLDLMISFF